jgi:hypothetical protein
VIKKQGGRVVASPGRPGTLFSEEKDPMSVTEIRPKRKRPPAALRVVWLVNPNDAGPDCPGIVELTRGKEEPRSYYVSPLGCDFGRAFRVEKFCSQQDPAEPDSYDVHQDEEGHWHCECKGHLKWQVECKHIASCRQLAESNLV